MVVVLEFHLLSNAQLSINAAEQDVSTWRSLSTAYSPIQHYVQLCMETISLSCRVGERVYCSSITLMLVVIGTLDLRRPFTFHRLCCVEELTKWDIIISTSDHRMSHDLIHHLITWCHMTSYVHHLMSHDLIHVILQYVTWCRITPCARYFISSSTDNGFGAH